LVLPLAVGISGHFGLGGKIQGLSLGIVNEEVDSILDCSNKSSFAVERRGFDCSFDKISCRFINAIDGSQVEKVFAYLLNANCIMILCQLLVFLDLL
jgi:hypothetical protein